MKTIIVKELLEVEAIECKICRTRMYPIELYAQHMLRHIKTNRIIKTYSKEFNRLRLFNALVIPKAKVRLRSGSNS